MSTSPLSRPFSIFLLAVLSSAILSQAFQVEDLPQRLPYTILPFKPPNQIFSGFRESYVVNVEAQSYYKVLTDIEAVCAMNINEAPFYSRLFVISVSEAYYYCPKFHLIYKLNPNANFIFSGTPITLKDVPIFNETKFITPNTNNGTLYILGLIDAPNVQDPTAHNFTHSYFLRVNTSTHAFNLSNITGAHSEPIVNIDVTNDGEVVATGEKLYMTNQKLNTYYLGKFGDLYYNFVIDFYIAPSYNFIPKVKMMINDAYVLYTSQTDLFRYKRSNSNITSQPGITLVSNQYIRGDGSKISWNEVPMTTSAKGDSIYVYNSGTFKKIDVVSMNLISTMTVPINVSNATYCQFYFYQEGTTEMAFLQMDDHAVSFALDASQTEII